jgi:hypothetical protein
MIANAKDFQIIARHDDVAVAKVLVGRPRYCVIEMSGRTMVMDLAYRTTEEQARKRANLEWLSHKYGPAEGQRRYTELYPGKR